MEMKKVFILMLCLALALGGMAFAEGQDIFAVLNGYEWSFLSGAGGWSTDMRIRADGSFAGEYHDSEMGETGEGYPDGSVYFCSFSGQMSVAEQINEKTWKIHVDRLEKEPAQESVEDGIRYVPADIYGLSEGDEMILYAPETPVSVLSEEMQLWAHVIDQETPPTELEDWFLMSEKNDSGFVGYPTVNTANPWEDLTAGELETVSGLTFGVPGGAEGVIYRFLRSEDLAEMQFMIGSDIFNARIQPAVLEEGRLQDVSWMISGLAYDWENEEPVSIGPCCGTIQQARADGENRIEVCLWYDAEQNLMYSLSVWSADPDGLDLTAIAEQIYNK